MPYDNGVAPSDYGRASSGHSDPPAMSYRRSPVNSRVSSNGDVSSRNGPSSPHAYRLRIDRND